MKFLSNLVKCTNIWTKIYFFLNVKTRKNNHIDIKSDIVFSSCDAINERTERLTFRINNQLFTNFTWPSWWLVPGFRQAFFPDASSQASYQLWNWPARRTCSVKFPCQVASNAASLFPSPQAAALEATIQAIWNSRPLLFLLGIYSDGCILNKQEQLVLMSIESRPEATFSFSTSFLISTSALNWLECVYQIGKMYLNCIVFLWWFYDEILYIFVRADVTYLLPTLFTN